MKTVRFSQVVERSGQPHVHSLWLAPERDAELKAAEKAHRVMTVSPPERGKADVGTVGFDPQLARNGQVLIFPKPLRSFANARVVGVKFDLVEQPATHAAKIAETLAGTGRGPKRQPKRDDTAAANGPTPAHRESRTTPASAKTTTGEMPSAHGHADHRTIAATARATAHPPALNRRAKAPNDDTETAALKDTIRAALDELRDGKTVAAYQRLERALR